MPRKADSAAAAAFLDQFCPGEPRHVVAMAPDGRPIFRTFECKEVAETEKCIEDKQGTNNWYFSFNRLKPSAYNRKAKKSDVEAVLWLHVDIDDTEALGRILAYKLLPTVTIFSGGGYQCFYRLASPTTDFDRAERCNRALARALGGDNCHNIDRVMRVPFTVNVPNAKKRAAGRVPTVSCVVEEATDWSRQYDIASFGEDTVTESTALSPASQPADVQPKAIDELSVTVADTLRSLIERGDDELAPMGTPGARYPSRSEVVFRVACDLARAGCSDAEIAGVLLNSDYGISSSVREKQQSKKYALKQAQSALAAIGTGWPDMARFEPVLPCGTRFSPSAALVCTVRTTSFTAGRRSVAMHCRPSRVSSVTTVPPYFER